MNNALPEKIVDAYRVNPMLAALLVLNLTTLCGFGWYLWDKETKTGAYIQTLQSDLRNLRTTAIDTAIECGRGHRR